MSKKYSNNGKNVTDASELDPCLAAESRMKQNMLSDRMKAIFIAIGVLVIILLFLGLLFLYLGHSSWDEENYDDPIIVEKTEKQKNDPAYDDYEETPKPFVTKIHRPAYTPSTTPRTRRPAYNPIDPYIPLREITMTVIATRQPTTTTTSTTTTTPAPITSTTTSTTTTTTTSRLIPSLIPIELTTAATTTTASTSSSTSTTTTTTSTTSSPTTTTTPKITTTTASTTTYAAPQPTVSVSTWSSLQAHPTNVPVTHTVRESCLEHRGSGLGSGIYLISPDGWNNDPFFVFCDQETDGGGWTVIQRRLNGEDEFYNRYFKAYEDGFGNLRGNHWLGLQYIHRIAPRTNQQVLRIELRGDTCVTKGCSNMNDDGYWWGEWIFSISGKADNYRLKITPTEEKGNMTSPFISKAKRRWETDSNGQPFTALDADNDQNKDFNCAQFRNYGGWWHKDCTVLSLNGKYGDRGQAFRYLAFYRDGEKDSYIVKPRQTLMMLRPDI